MHSAQRTTDIAHRVRRARVTFEEGLQHRIAALLQERAVLDEEVRQLRAAVQIYSVVRAVCGWKVRAVPPEWEIPTLTKSSAYIGGPSVLKQKGTLIDL
ncbi:MAG: hypothetical protein ABI759_11570 [Candidatus Solibacter sp.]